MDTLLSHTTALELLRSHAPLRRLARFARTGAEPPALPPTSEDVRSIAQRFPGLTLPLHVTLSNKNKRGPRNLVTAHVTEVPLPHDSTIVVAKGIRCVSPEHLVVQMASALSLLELVFLLGEMLGTYAICPSHEDGMLARETPLTSKERILTHLDALGPARGTSLVRRALSLACEGSASPYETKLSMRLGLKPALGGYHLNVLAMNEPIKVARLGSGLDVGVRKPDVLLGARESSAPYSGVSFDYNGRVHELARSVEHDIRRQNELLAIGFKNYVLTKALYDDLDYMDDVVERARADLGLPRLHLTRDERARRRRLRFALYLELEQMDGITWRGGGTSLSMEEVYPTLDEPVVDVVPVEVYGLE